MKTQIVISLILFISLTNVQSQINTAFRKIDKEIYHHSYERAIDSIDRYLKFYPDNEVLNSYKGAIYILQGDSGVWLDNYIFSLELDSIQSKSYFRIGELYYKSAIVVMESQHSFLDTENGYTKYLIFTIKQLCQLSLPFYENA